MKRMQNAKEMKITIVNISAIGKKQQKEDTLPSAVLLILPQLICF